MTLASDRNALRLREETHRALWVGDRLEQYGANRTCAAEGCEARLSRYNPGTTCSLHRGWVSIRTRTTD
jgi:hypothetical protein